MSSVGSPLTTSLVQTAQAQQAASQARDRERVEAQRGPRPADQVELRVAGVELADAVRPLPHNDSEQAEAEQRARDRTKAAERPRIDVRA